MKPSEKTEEIEEFLVKLLGKERREIIRGDECVGCDNPNLSFRDEDSIKEYTISGFCQDCQDSIFNEHRDEGVIPF